jgi:calcium/calmodulin-dependent protein kinase I
MQFREIEVLKSIRKVICGAIKLQDVFEDEYYIYTVLEYMDGHDLYEYSNNVELNESHIRRIMLQLSETLRDLHRVGVLHCDIKLENIMMSHRANSNHEVPA